MFIAIFIITGIVFLVLINNYKKQERKERRYERKRERQEAREYKRNIRRENAYWKKYEKKQLKQQERNEKIAWKRQVAENKRQERVWARQETRRAKQEEKSGYQHSQSIQSMYQYSQMGQDRYQYNQMGQGANDYNESKGYFEFNDGLTEDEFRKIVYVYKKSNKRIIGLECDGPKIYGEVLSLSKKSSWEFTIDFNRHGHINKGYRLWQENDDSDIPWVCAEIIKGEIDRIIADKEMEPIRMRQREYLISHVEPERLNYCYWCGNAIWNNTGKYCRFCGGQIRL